MKLPKVGEQVHSVCALFRVPATLISCKPVALISVSVCTYMSNVVGGLYIWCFGPK